MKLTPQKYIACDSETTGLDMWGKDFPFAVSLCDDLGNTWFTQWKVNENTREVEPNQADIQFLTEIFSGKENASRGIEFVFHNRPFDSKMLSKVEVQIDSSRCHDTAISAKIVNNLEISYGLKDLGDKYLGVSPADEKALVELVRKCRKRAQVYNDWIATPNNRPLIKTGRAVAEDYWLPRFFDENDNTLETYAVQDAVRTMGLWMLHCSIFEEDPQLLHGYEMERAIFEATDAMVARGMCISPEKIDEQLIRAEQSLVLHHNEMLKIIKEQNLHPWEHSYESASGLALQQTNTPWAFSQAKSARTLRLRERVAKKIEEEGEEGKLATFNPRSSSQIRRVLFLSRETGGLGLPIDRETKMGPAIDRNVLKGFMYEPFVKELMAYRSAKQAKTLFLERYKRLMVEEQWLSEKEGRPQTITVLHPGLNQMGAAATGRFSGSNPNLQQVRNVKVGMVDEGGELYNVRAVFMPRPGFRILCGDYSQQEVRVFASIAKIPFLLQEIHAGRDPNDSCANKVWGGKGNESGIHAAALALDLGRLTPSNPFVAQAWGFLGWNERAAREFGFSSDTSLEVADDWLAQFDWDIVKAEKSVDRKNSRQRAKCSIFAKLYGGGPSSVTGLLCCTFDEAKKFLMEYDKAFPEITTFSKRLMREARLNGFIVNPYGRKLFIDPDFIYRCVNYLVQSTAASMMKDSIRRCHSYIKESGLDAHLLLTVHDELQIEVREDHLYEWFVDDLQSIMENNMGRIKIPMPVEFECITESWDKKGKIIYASN